MFLYITAEATETVTFGTPIAKYSEGTQSRGCLTLLGELVAGSLAFSGTAGEADGEDMEVYWVEENVGQAGRWSSQACCGGVDGARY
jgi:hypothetical protein